MSDMPIDERMMDRRLEPRLLCADLVDVRWRDGSGKMKRAVANLEDISISGACVQTDVPLPPGAAVRISYPRGQFVGTVRYCQFKEIGYFTGIQFETGTRWDSTDFKPLHLLDPRTLLKKAPGRAKPANFNPPPTQ
jgi:hypothetical protein